MRTLWAASLRHLLQHPPQLALALTGLALGVATITAVDIATASAGRAFELSMDAVNGAATHEIVGASAGLEERLYARLRISAIDVELAPVIEGYVIAGGRTLQLLGIDPFVDIRVRGHGGTADPTADSMRWFTERGAVSMSAQTAQQLGLAAGDSFTVTVSGRAYAAKLLTTLNEASVGFETLLLTDIAQAQEWLGMVGLLSRIDVRVPAGRAGEAALARLRAMLPPGVQLHESQRRTEQSLDMSRAFTINLQAMSMLALLVSVFLIYSAISFAVVQRRRIFGVLRALGATRTNVLAIVLVEAAALGIVGSLLGLVLGTAIGRELIALVSRTINDLYFVVAVNEVVLPRATIIKAVLAGFSVALVAAVVPAIEVANSAPYLGLRRSALERHATHISRWLLVASVLLAAASGLIVLGFERSLSAGFAALFVLLLAVATLAPAALQMLAAGAAHIAARFSPTVRIALGDIAASLSRTGVAVAALGIAIAAMIGVAIMVGSFRESLRGWLERTLRADFYISAPGPGFARPERKLDPAVMAAVLAIPGVAAHSESRRVIVDSAYGPITLDALNLAAQAYPGIELIKGDAMQVWSAFDQGALVISEPLAWRLKLSRGNTLRLATAAGWRAFEIAGIYRDYGNDRGNVLMSRKVYRQWWRDDSVTALGLYMVPGANEPRVAEALRNAARQVPPPRRQALFIRSNAEVRTLSLEIFERTFAITRVLYWLAGGVAAIGLVSALLAWELERSRELAIVRSLGLTPRGAALLIETQTGFMGLVAFLAAVPAGLLTAWILIGVINRRAFGWQIEFHWHAAQFSNALLLALAAALSAGLYPAFRNARVPIAREMREE